ncbi:MAG: PAS domain S-box protein [Rhodospirillales bacterium]|nr:PAS domain S-box protein [Rhodospirillales bacterium]
MSDRRRAEDALRESEARWRSIIEMHDQAIVIVDHKHDIRFVNRAALTLFGKTSQELIGVPFGYPLVQGEVAEIEILRPRQGVAYTEMRAIPMRWSGEDHFLLFLRDMSAYKRAEGDLRKLFQAIEQSPASVVITDIEGRIEYVNPKFTESTGYTYAEVVGKNPRFLKSGFTPPRDYEDLWQTITSGNVWHGELLNKQKSGGTFWELVSIAPVRDARGKVTHFVAVKEDIDERKATEDRLRHAQKMETIGQLTGGLAHDFNNLLAIIIGNLQLLEEKAELDSEIRELIADALWSAERGAQLTHRLLAFARRQRLNPKLTDLNDVVGEMTDLMRRTIGEKIFIKEVLAPGLWKAMVDRSQLESSLLNLVVNSRDAMPEGGKLTIATENAQLPLETNTEGEEAAPGDYVALKVTDTGVACRKRC